MQHVVDASRHGGRQAAEQFARVFRDCIEDGLRVVRRAGERPQDVGRRLLVRYRLLVTGLRRGELAGTRIGARLA